MRKMLHTDIWSPCAHANTHMNTHRVRNLTSGLHVHPCTYMNTYRVHTSDICPPSAHVYTHINTYRECTKKEEKNILSIKLDLFLK